MAANILPVDHDKSLMDSAQASPGGSGYRLVASSYCREALSLLSKETIDLTLPDLLLRDPRCQRMMNFLDESQVGGRRKGNRYLAAGPCYRLPRARSLQRGTEGFQAQVVKLDRNEPASTSNPLRRGRRLPFATPTGGAHHTVPLR